MMFVCSSDIFFFGFQVHPQRWASSAPPHCKMVLSGLPCPHPRAWTCPGGDSMKQTCCDSCCNSCRLRPSKSHEKRAKNVKESLNDEFLKNFEGILRIGYDNLNQLKFCDVFCKRLDLMVSFWNSMWPLLLSTWLLFAI